MASDPSLITCTPFTQPVNTAWQLYPGSTFPALAEPSPLHLQLVSHIPKLLIMCPWQRKFHRFPKENHDSYLQPTRLSLPLLQSTPEYLSSPLGMFVICCLSSHSLIVRFMKQEFWSIWSLPGISESKHSDTYSMVFKHQFNEWMGYMNDSNIIIF